MPDREFACKPKLRHIQGPYYSLQEPLIYCAGKGVVINIPRGFVTDLSSVPRFIQWLIPKRGRYDDAAVIHDWLYSQPHTARLTADALFLDAMQTLGVSRWRRSLMFIAVRLFGWSYKVAASDS